MVVLLFHVCVCVCVSEFSKHSDVIIFYDTIYLLMGVQTTYDTIRT